MQPIIHTLAAGATVIVTSPGHGFKFSDGTECGPQLKEICNVLTCARQETHIKNIKGMAINSTEMVLSNEGLNLLEEISMLADIVIVPLPVLLDIRHHRDTLAFSNIVAMNATSETQRSAPADKIIDINNWSW